MFKCFHTYINHSTKLQVFNPLNRKCVREKKSTSPGNALIGQNWTLWVMVWCRSLSPLQQKAAYPIFIKRSAHLAYMVRILLCGEYVVIWSLARTASIFDVEIILADIIWGLNWWPYGSESTRGCLSNILKCCHTVSRLYYFLYEGVVQVMLERYISIQGIL